MWPAGGFRTNDLLVPNLMPTCIENREKCVTSKLLKTSAFSAAYCTRLNRVELGRFGDYKIIYIFGCSADNRPAFDAALFSDTVSRIPDGSRFATLTEAPNNERMRYATGGPNPKSPPGVLASPIEKRSKNFAKAGPGIVLP